MTTVAERQEKTPPSLTETVAMFGGSRQPVVLGAQLPFLKWL
jgi:hypothetical protein